MTGHHHVVVIRVVISLTSRAIATPFAGGGAHQIEGSVSSRAPVGTGAANASRTRGVPALRPHYRRLSCLPWRTAARRLFTPSLA
jgi:hypothetical protein